DDRRLRRPRAASGVASPPASPSSDRRRDAGDPSVRIVTAAANSLATAAAELAATLRLAGRAWLFGADAWTAVAESSFSPVAEDGIAWRREDLADATSGARWPDVIGADQGGDPLRAARDLSTRGAPPPVVWGPATRPLLVALEPSASIS